VSTLLRPAPDPSRPLEGRYATAPRAEGLRPTPATMELVRGQVRALLLASPSWTAMDDDEQKHIERKLVRIAGYAAECLREMCWQSEMLGQTPVLKPQPRAAPLARAQAGDFSPRAGSQIGRITEQTLKAIAFPTFVADLIRGTFNAIVQTSIQQLEAFAALLDNVSKTVDQFTADNISDNQARDWLAQRYPDHIMIEGGKAVGRTGSEDKPLPDFRRDLNLPDTVSSIDESTIEETLLPAARRRLAETRLQILSSLVLMGVNRIIVHGGKIRATMGFHIDTTDRSHEEHASDVDFRAAASGRYGDSFGFSPWSVSASTSVSYVTSSRRNDDAEINVNTDLTGEVELHFKTTQIPLDRFANGSTIGRIQNNTANPDANTPVGGAPAPFTEPPTVGGDVRAKKLERPAPPKPVLPPIGTPLKEPKLPTKPVPVEEAPTDPMQKIKLEEERRRRKEKGELVPEADPTLKLDEKKDEAKAEDTPKTDDKQEQTDKKKKGGAPKVEAKKPDEAKPDNSKKDAPKPDAKTEDAHEGDSADSPTISDADADAPTDGHG
jgi:hypothetical protein